FIEQVPEDTIFTAEIESRSRETSFLAISSTPESVLVRVDNSSDSRVTPFEMEIGAGVHRFIANRDGFESLEYEYDFPGSVKLNMNFVMGTEQPSGYTAEELELEYKEIKIPRNEQDAEKTKEKFNNLAETFIIIPTGQGVLAKLVMGKDRSGEADFLISVGIGMTVTAYLMGKVISSRQLKKIKTENALSEQENHIAKEHNRNVNNILEEKNSEALEKWYTENEGKGIVEIVIE
ncbi:MAG: hypothetical protein V3W18_14430, partial [candidate division Zixibacteria bacterium]